MLKYDFSGVLFGEILDVSHVTRWQRGFTTVSFCVGVLNDRLDPTPSPGVRLPPVCTSFRSSSKNAVIGGISSLLGSTLLPVKLLLGSTLLSVKLLLESTLLPVKLYVRGSIR